MQIQILNKFEQSGDRWSYSAQFKYNGKWIPVSGVIGRPKSKSKFKEILREKIKRQIAKYIEANKPPETFNIPEQGVFVNELS